MRPLARAVAGFLTHRAILRLLGLAVGAILIWASVDKIAHPDRFADAVHDYRMLPTAFINAFALALPWVEAVAGAALVLGVWRRAAGLVSTALCAAFLIAIAQAELRGLKIECGCFTVSATSGMEASWTHFCLDALLLAAAALVWRRG